MMTKQKKISYAIIALTFVLVWALHLPTMFITALFSYFILTKLQFRGNKVLAMGLFCLVVVIVCLGGVSFSKHAYAAGPHIVAITVPAIVDFARLHGIELPFQDYQSMKDALKDTIIGQYANIGHYTKVLAVEIVEFIVGLVVAGSLFMSKSIKLEAEDDAIPDNIYVLVWDELLERFRLLYQSFSKVMGAQIVISSINSILTTIFLLWCQLPYAIVLVMVTFCAGLLPIVGNLISNTLIVCVALTISPKMALIALLYLIALHKLEYFLNSKIIGDRIKNPLWLTLIALVVGEVILGIPGMVLAPMVLYYIKVEASTSQL
jgi:predicted PurR-regulated permease PerM